MITFISLDVIAQKTNVLIGDSLSIDRLMTIYNDPARRDENGGWVTTVVHNIQPPDFIIEKFDIDSVYVLFLKTRSIYDTLAEKSSEEIVLDRIALTFDRSQYTLVDTWCQCNDKKDESIFVVAKDDFEPYFENILRAWHVNKEHRRFEEISTNGIKCENMGYGD
jgi:hypothetical protein